MKCFLLALLSLISLSKFSQQVTHPDGLTSRVSVPGEIVISQVYGAGGNSGATFRNDFVEIFNRGGNPANLAGWAVQYTSATGTSWSKVDLSGTLLPGRYLLVQLAGGANGAMLPAPDVTGSIAMAATAGKVALTNSTTLLSGSCPAASNIVDFVGYGVTASCFEGAGPTPAPGTTTAVRRGTNGCQDTDQNSTDFASAATAPRNSASPVNPCSSGGGARFSKDDVRISREQPDVCGAIIMEVQLTNSGTRPQRDNPGAEFAAQSAKGLKIVPGSCQVTGTGICNEASEGVNWNGSVSLGASVTIRWQMKLDLESTSVGSEACVGVTVNYDANDDGINEATTNVESCSTITCQAGFPGIAIPAASEQGDDRPGSILVFPFYSSNASAPAKENTLFSLTSTSTGRAVSLHVFFVADESPSLADVFICLSANQTRSFLASEIDPNSAGYMIVIAVDSVTGCPINFNYLIGEEAVKLEEGHAATLGAEAFSALSDEPAECSASSTTAEIRFDGTAFSRATRVAAMSNIPSSSEGYDSLLIVSRLGGSMLTGASTLGQINGLLFNDAEVGFSFSANTSRRQLRMHLNDSFPRTVPRLVTIIPAGATGWCKLWLTSEGALFGVSLVANSQVRISPSAHVGGRNLHKLKLTDGARLTIPVFPPSC